MDPDANWREAVLLAARLESFSYDDRTEQLDDGQRLGELITSLNTWVMRGGFPPAVFTRKK